MRASGLLLPIFSLPGKYGIGCFSDEAYRFVDFVKEAGQKYWQILPVGPTGYGDSPYQSFSAFAGNPYFISPDTLVREGLLTEEEAAETVYHKGTLQASDTSDTSDISDGETAEDVHPAGTGRKEASASDDGPVDYAWLYRTREPLLRKAYARWKQGGSADTPPGGEDRISLAASDRISSAASDRISSAASDRISFAAFCEENAAWLPDYALFMALKKEHGGAGFLEWEQALRMREPAALEAARHRLRDEIEFQTFLQYRFEVEWTALKAYANLQGISIIGDIPIYVPADSAEVWAYPELFQLREDGTCKAVAGVPPDGFSAIGQLWGNPLYNWDHHRQTGFAWWISRMRRCSSLFDIVRIDHFRGFDQYYAIPADSADARTGRWENGPGLDLFRAIEKEIPGLTIIAEDLGYITESVRRLVRDTGYPNMKVLEFAFDSRDSSGRESYLPYNYDKNCVVYTGTHDNETLVGWLDHILPQERDEVRAFTGLDGAYKDPMFSDAGEVVPAHACDAEEVVPAHACDAEEVVPAQARDALEDPVQARAAETKRLARAMVREAMASVGNLCVIPMQDWLLLGDEARINTPSTTGGNWVWRMRQGAASPALAAQIRKMTKVYGRL